MRLEDPPDLPATARYLQRDAISGKQGLSERIDPVRRTRHPTCRTGHAVFADRDHAELAVHIESDRTADPSRQPHSLTSTQLTMRENQRDNDTDRYELNRSIQASRRGGRTKSPSSKPIDQNGLPVCVLPNAAPIPDRPTLRSGPDRATPPVSCLEKQASGVL